MFVVDYVWHLPTKQKLQFPVATVRKISTKWAVKNPLGNQEKINKQLFCFVFLYFYDSKLNISRFWTALTINESYLKIQTWTFENF